MLKHAPNWMLRHPKDWLQVFEQSQNGFLSAQFQPSSKNQSLQRQRHKAFVAKIGQILNNPEAKLNQTKVTKSFQKIPEHGTQFSVL